MIDSRKFLVSLFCIIGGCSLFGQSEIKRVEGARTEMKEAFSSYRAAESALDNAANILSTEWYSLKRAVANVDTLKMQSDGLAKSAQTFGINAAEFKIKFATDVEKFKSAKSALENIAKTTPLAEKKISEISALIDSLQKQIALNPGNLYQDKNYFDKLRANFLRAVDSLTAAQESVASTLVNFSIATPKIEGVAPALKLADEYFAKLNALNSENAKELANVQNPLNKLEDQYLEAQKTFAYAAENVNKSSENLQSAYAILTDFMLNIVPTSDKFKNADFAKMAIFDSPLPISKYQKTQLNRQRSFPVSTSCPFENKDEDTTDGFAEKSKNYLKQAESRVAQESIRKEFLEKFNAIENATFEISEACKFLRFAVSSALNKSLQIDSDIADAQSLSTRAISLFSDAQRLQSQIMIADTANKILSSRAEIFKVKFAKLLKEAEKKVLQALKKADDSTAVFQNLKNQL